MKQDGDHIHKELLDGCLLLSEERLPEKGVWRGRSTDREAVRAPGSRICSLHPNRTEAKENLFPLS